MTNSNFQVPSSNRVQNLVEKTKLGFAGRPVSLPVVREPYILDKVVFVGGHPGCGKTMLTPIIGSLDRVEIMKYNYAMEHICCLRLLEKLDPGSATVMIKMLTDLDIYHMMMSRETNFRFKDLSSIFKNPGKLRYIRRLFLKGDEHTIPRIRKERPILHHCVHNLLVISPPLMEALEDRMRMIVIVRHPLYMIVQWYLYVEHYGKDPRDFTIWIGHEKNKAVPFFALGWEEKYFNSNAMEKSIYSIEHLSNLEEQVLEAMTPEQRARVLVIPFEYFVFNPEPYMEEIENLLGTRMTKATLREMKRQKVPRKMLAEGIDLPVYSKKCGWTPPEHRTEKEEMAKRREYAEKLASREAMAVLDRLGECYEKRWNLHYV